MCLIVTKEDTTVSSALAAAERDVKTRDPQGLPSRVSAVQEACVRSLARQLLSGLLAQPDRSRRRIKESSVSWRSSDREGERDEKARMREARKGSKRSVWSTWKKRSVGEGGTSGGRKLGRGGSRVVKWYRRRGRETERMERREGKMRRISTWPARPGVCGAEPRRRPLPPARAPL